MRNITICLPYYENPGMLVRQYDSLRAMPDDVKSRVTLIVVDDGSPDNPARAPDRPIGSSGFKLFRMLVDIPWNQDACRNLGVHHAKDGWMILTDIDHLIPEKTIRAVLRERLDEGIAYQFLRVSEPRMEPYKTHPNSWLITKRLYDLVGGYDERFAASFGRVWGIYGTDGRFKKQVLAVARIRTFKGSIIRVPREVTPDASTTRIERRTPEMESNRAVVRELIKNSGRREPVTLSFPWERVA